MYRLNEDVIRFEDQETETANNMPLYTNVETDVYRHIPYNFSLCDHNDNCLNIIFINVKLILLSLYFVYSFIKI